MGLSQLCQFDGSDSPSMMANIIKAAYMEKNQDAIPDYIDKEKNVYCAITK